MIVLSTVLLANAGLGLYLLLREPTPQAPEPALTAPELGRELALLKPPVQPQQAAANAAGATQGERTATAGSPGPAVPAEPTGGPAAAVSCRYWGPFDSEGEARRQLAELEAAGIVDTDSGARVSGTRIQADPDFMIFLGPFPSAANARSVRDELSGRGSDASVVTQGERFVVSTGVFSQQRFALAQTAKLQGWGYEPKQTELIRTRRVYFLLADIDDARFAEIDLNATVDRASGGVDGDAEPAGSGQATGGGLTRAAGPCDDIASQYGIL